MNNTDQKQSWSLAIATYKREDILPICLELAARQTRPPKDIVVVDASPDWETTRGKIMNELAPRFPEIAWRYDKAKIASAASQRNQCVELATGDVLFLFDDDSLMFEDCAEKLMEMYDLDPQRQIAGASPMEVGEAPTLENPRRKQVEASEIDSELKPKRRYNPLVKWVRGALGADDIFVPYDPEFPDLPIPPAVKALGVGRRRLMAGMTMTVRREYAMKERFEEILKDRGPEDSDMSYRVSRHGALVTVLDSALHHVGSPGGRFSRFSREALGAMGPLVLHRFYSTDLSRSKKRSRAMLRRRMMIGFLKDLKSRQFRLPESRGFAFGLKHIDRIFKMSEAELRAWYPDYQVELIKNKG